jgi:deoxyribodipyrimidine photolyase-related protein
MIVLPNQLFKMDKFHDNKDNYPKKVYLIEHPKFFTRYKYHKAKIVLHRASMRYYRDYLADMGYKVEYIDFSKYHLPKEAHIEMFDPIDIEIANEIRNHYGDNNVKYKESPMFITTLEELHEYTASSKNDAYHQTTFYIWQRKRLGILMDADKPIGGKWTYDVDNRDKFPKDYIESPIKPRTNKYIKEAREYCAQHFSQNYGDNQCYVPITHDEADKHLTEFLSEHLAKFGQYQDAVKEEVVIGYHSLLSPMLNIGLITPRYVVDTTLTYYEKHKKVIPLASVEGFIRQIIGWREIVRMTYMFKHKTLTNTNHFKHIRKLDNSWYDATTEIAPIDAIIRRVLTYGYAHHIERLMFLGNFMLLSGIDLRAEYDWFMIMFVDAYEWVMEPNVYAMSAYSTGCGQQSQSDKCSKGLLMTRPYFSSSNYILKMSDFKKDGKWDVIWDALYYAFINANKQEFAKNYSTANAVSVWNKKSASEKNKLLTTAKEYLRDYKK